MIRSPTTYKLIKSVIPCLLLTLCIGFCYAFSVFALPLAEHFKVSKSAIQMVFCINIFCLGMGAAFFGPLVEKHIKIAAFISAFLLFAGFLCGAAGVQQNQLWLVYLGIGMLCGISEGCGYVVPVKNLLLWWNKSKHKGLVAAMSIISFGLGSALCAMIVKHVMPYVGIQRIFVVLGGLYLLPTLLSAYLIEKPRYAQLQAAESEPAKLSELLKDSFFRKSWMFMFLNISMGLILIGSCANILKEAGLVEWTANVVMVCGLFNGGGRLVFPFISDYMKNRLNIWILLLTLEVILLVCPCLVFSIVWLTIICVNATYGAAFATLPSVLLDHYGTKQLSAIHGYVLSSWGFASLFAYICTTTVLAMFDSYHTLMFVLAGIYAVNLMIVLSLRSSLKSQT